MVEKITLFDPAEGLTSDEAIAAFMVGAFTSGDVGYVAHALGVVERAKGMTQLRKIRAFRARNSTARSASTATRR
jgi:probable addiction module antidote protein